MNETQRKSMNDSYLMKLLFADDSCTTLRLHYNCKNGTNKRTKYEQEDCTKILNAIDNLLQSNGNALLQQETSLWVQLNKGLQELRMSVLSRRNKLSEEATRVAASRERTDNRLQSYGMSCLIREGCLEPYLIFDGSTRKVKSCYWKLEQEFRSMNPWDFITLEKHEPKRRMERSRFYQKEEFSVGSPFLLMKLTSNNPNERNLFILMKLPYCKPYEDLMEIPSFKTSMQLILNKIPRVISLQERTYIEDILRDTVGGAALDRRLLMRLLLPGHSMSVNNNREESMDKLKLLQRCGIVDPDLIIDMRYLNGAQAQYEPFFLICEKIMDEAMQFCQEKRHGSDIIESDDLCSIADLHRMACKRAEAHNANLEGVSSPGWINMPTITHLQHQFIPRNRCHNTASTYTGRFQYKLLMTRATRHIPHPHYNYTEACTSYVQAFVLMLHHRYGVAVSYFETDDKNKIPLSERGHEISATQRSRAVVTKATGSSASSHKTTDDHDAGGSIVKLIPTVTVYPDIGNIEHDKSWMQGDLYVAVKDSILQPSTALRSKANSIKLYMEREDRSTILVSKTDGGPEHNFEHMSVLTGAIAGVSVP